MENKNKILMKNNILIQAKYNLNLIENRVFTTLLYKFQKNKNEIYSCEMTHEELKLLIKNTNKGTVKGIESVLESLMSKKISIKEMGQNDKWHTYTLIGGFTRDNNKFTIEALPKIYDLLKDYYETGYTPVNMTVVLGMNNYYGQRFYEILRLWSASKGIINYKVEYIKECFEISDKYKNYKDFRKRVLEPGIQALNSTGYFYVETREIKEGRKVDSIDFIVKDLDKRVYFDNVKEIKNNQNVIELDAKVKTETFVPSPIAQNKLNDFYVPNKKLFTLKTLADFKKDFNNYDFKDKEYKKLLQESILIALEKDDEEKIKVKSYKYFKKTLENKIKDFESIKNKEIKKTKFHNFDETFDKYSDDEFDEMIRKSQYEKFYKEKTT